MRKNIVTALKKYKREVLFNSAETENKIREFDPAIYDNLRNSIYVVLPSIIYIKYNRPLTPPGNCMERSFILSTAIPNSYVAYGDAADIGIHYWVECDGVCYDPTSLFEYDKEVYYKLNNIRNVDIITREELDGLGFIKYCREKSFDDFKTDPALKDQLDAILTIVLNGVDYRDNPEYKSEIDTFINKIGYQKMR